jgi:hypothetical protein
LIAIVRELREAKGRGEVFNPRRLAEKVEVLEPTIDLSQLRLNIFAEIVDRIGVSWDEMFGRLKAYKDREGHCRVPQASIVNGFNLGLWVAVASKQVVFVPSTCFGAVCHGKEIFCANVLVLKMGCRTQKKTNSHTADFPYCERYLSERRAPGSDRANRAAYKGLRPSKGPSHP